jgi:N6-adenosine-specific RNA methylase IME4
MDPCVLYQTLDKTVTLLDIPRSIEVAQGFDNSKDGMRLISCKPLELPYPSTEPKSAKALAALEPPSIDELILQKHAQLALDNIRAASAVLWCLPRVIGEEDLPGKRRIRHDTSEETDRAPRKRSSINDNNKLENSQDDLPIFFHNATSAAQSLGNNSGSSTYVPPNSAFINGSIETNSHHLAAHGPKFNLVLLDPPWPNRSARRSHSYSISHGMPEISALLSDIPLQAHLADDALVGVWITNKSSFRDLVLKHGGLFDQWGLCLAEEWVWLKITSGGQPICSLEGRWRKPYEILLVGKSIASGRGTGSGVKRRVIIGVPDLHSRKPNLKTLFQEMLPPKYEALEVFARNLTAGWWSWGNEALKFQHESQWMSKADSERTS